MTIGIGTFPQGGQYAVVRSYVSLIAFAGILDYPTIVGNVFVFFPSVVPTDHYVVIVKPGVFAWSSNVYSLDFMIEEAYYVSNPDPTHRPVNYDLLYVPPTPTLPAHIRFKPFGYTDTPHYFALPPRTAPYWFPPV